MRDDANVYAPLSQFTCVQDQQQLCPCSPHRACIGQPAASLQLREQLPAALHYLGLRLSSVALICKSGVHEGQRDRESQENAGYSFL